MSIILPHKFHALSRNVYVVVYMRAYAGKPTNERQIIIFYEPSLMWRLLMNTIDSGRGRELVHGAEITLGHLKDFRRISSRFVFVLFFVGKRKLEKRLK